MSVKKRYLEHLEAKGAIPKGYASGGMVDQAVRHDTEWEDGDWNDHEDTSGEPETYGDNYMTEGYAFGGKIEASEHESNMPALHGEDYGRPNFPGPKEHKQVNQDMSEDEVRHHMARAISARRGRAR